MPPGPSGSRAPLTPLLLGDPARVAPGVTTLPALLDAIGLPAAEGPGFLRLAPGVGLVHALTAVPGTLALRWVVLPHGPPLGPAGEPIGAVMVLTGSLGESGRALRVAGRLAAGLADRDRLRGALAASTREDLVRALAALDEPDQARREAPLVAADVLALLRSGPGGLSGEEAARRRRVSGPNRLERVARRPLAWRLLEQFWSLFAILLWVGGGLALLAGMPELAWAIFAVIVINGVGSFVQEYRAERAIEMLQQLLPQEITVARDGRRGRLRAGDLVPGDVVDLEAGDQVPADGHLLEATALRLDQSALTGEPHPVLKRPTAAGDPADLPRPERRELVFAGTGVASGRGTCVVTATAMATEIGVIAHLTQAVAEGASPLQREMARVTRIVTVLAVGCGAGFFLLGVGTGVFPVAQGLVFALGVIVANVPEGLLPTLTLALALGVKRMARRKSLVKRLSSVETLGATTVICTDKTGTLTENRMTVRAVWASGRVAAVEAGGGPLPADVRRVLEVGVLASEATAEHGDPTEVAILAAAVAAGLDAEGLRQARSVVAPLPFDSFRKRMTLVRAGGARLLACTKGAPRETLALCQTIHRDGQAAPLTPELRAGILADHDRLAADGLRMLAVAERELPADQDTDRVEAVERDLTFLGLVAIWDPPRPDVAEAIALCRRAGIRIVMVTGDYGLTARAIARQIGLPVHKVVTGEEVERLPAPALQHLLAEAGVLFARTSPAHKLAIVNGLRALGEIVTVTGDGVNDAPALKAAHIGVAMGRRGSAVAKESAEMVITDDRFGSIVAAIQEGRAIYANIGKFVTYIFASNVPELVPFLAAVLLGLPLPLTLMQILAVDLGTDLLPALALGAEPPEPGVMERPPRSRTERLLSPGRLGRAYGFLGVIEAALSLGAFFWTYWVAGWRPGQPLAASGDLYVRATTMTLAGIVAAQVGNVFACRTDRESVFRVGLFANRGVLLGVTAEVGLLLALVLVPPLPWVFGLAPLAFAEWGVLLAFPPALLLLEEARKALIRLAARP